MEQVIGNYSFPPIASNIGNVARDYSPSIFGKGVILFDTAQTESVDTTFITGGNCIGHAGGSYAGADTTRGNFNITESGSITNGYKRVWDFATNQANGTINSICLTTDRGGNYGYGNTSTYQSLSEYSSFPLDSIINTQLTMYGATDYYGFTNTNKIYMAGFSTDAKKIYFQDGYNGTMLLRIFETPNSGALGFLQTLQMPTSAATNSYSKTLLANENLWLCVINGTIYGVLYNSSTKAAYLKTYSETFVELTSITLTGSKTLDLTPRFGIVNGYLFIYSGTTNVIRKYNSSTGAYVEDYTVPSGSVQRIQQFNNQFIMFWYNSNPTSVALYDGVNLYKWYLLGGNGLNYQMDSVCALYPEKSAILMAFISNIGAARLGANLFAPLLFTVNNLATPVSKTSSQTMKVTYTITW